MKIKKWEEKGIYKHFMIIKGNRKRYEQVKEDEKGLYIEEGNNLFKSNDRYYLNEQESKKYKDIVKHNKEVQKRREDVEEAKKEGRYTKVEQVIKKGNKTGVYSYEYYDKKGKDI